MPYDRDLLIDVLVHHQRTSIRGCPCGWGELGKSWAEHVALVYENTCRATGRTAPPLPEPNPNESK